MNVFQSRLARSPGSTEQFHAQYIRPVVKIWLWFDKIQIKNFAVKKLLIQFGAGPWSVKPSMN
jgi:hypothetical protein